jgi:hypothetical protein
VHRIGVWRTDRHQSMSGLVVGNDLLLFLAEEAIFLLKAGDNALDGLFQVRHLNRLLVRTGCQ